MAAAGAEFSMRGYSGATTAAIARRADITEAQLFRYFASKSDLFAEAVFKPLNKHFEDFHSRHMPVPGESAEIEARANLYIKELRSFIEEHARMLLSMLVARTYAPQGVADAGDLEGLTAYFERGAAMLGVHLGDQVEGEPALLVRVSFAAVLACVLFEDLMFPPSVATKESVEEAVRRFVVKGLGMDRRPAEAGRRRSRKTAGAAAPGAS